MNDLQEKMMDVDAGARELLQCNMQIQCLQRDCATKEDTIHKIRMEKKQAQVLANQVQCLPV